MEDRKKVLFITAYNPNLRSSWSGVPYNLEKQLEKEFDVDVLYFPIRKDIIYRVYNKIKRILTGKRVIDKYRIPRARKNAKATEKILKKKKYDAIFSIDRTSIALVNTKTPVIFYGDATIMPMINYYYYNLSLKNIEEANYIQKCVFRVSSYNIFTNRWAMESAVRDYDVIPDKTKVIHLGANIEDTYCYEKKNNNINQVNLLFCGSDWQRKGGDFAIDIVKTLSNIDKTRKYVLHMCGGKPSREILDKNIIIHGILNRDNDSERDKYYELWSNTDIFISPAKAECAAASLCDACFFGVPSITFDTGGVSDHVIEGYNGYRLSLDSDPIKFAQKIIELAEDVNLYNDMRRNARKLYEEELNWETAGERIRDTLKVQIERDKSK